MAASGRRLVVGFGTATHECGWAATIDLLHYEMKRRAGEWESTYVGAAGRVQQLIVANSHDEAVRLRDYLNHEPHQACVPLLAKRGLTQARVDVIRRILDAAWTSGGTSPDSDLRELLWSVVDLPEESVRELQALMMATKVQSPNIVWWSDRTEFPFDAVIFDLDQTLVDSSSLRTPEARRAWAKHDSTTEVAAIPVAGPVAPHELPGLLSERGVPVGIATRSPHGYAEQVIDAFRIHTDILVAGSGDKTASIRSCATSLEVDPSKVIVVGDDESDIRAARAVGATSLGFRWEATSWNDRLQPDITSLSRPSCSKSRTGGDSATWPNRETPMPIPSLTREAGSPTGASKPMRWDDTSSPPAADTAKC